MLVHPKPHCCASNRYRQIISKTTARRMALTTLPLGFSLDDGIQWEFVKARNLICEPCDTAHAVALNREWHSRLPVVQNNPWQFAFRAHYRGRTCAVALWNNPSTRSLPSHWLELRRLACAPFAPRFTASKFLSAMVRWFARYHADREKCISYQDTAVHTGTIYRAANWHIAFQGHERQRDRSKPRINTHGQRMYRTSSNGLDADRAAKVRWEIELRRSTS